MFIFYPRTKQKHNTLVKQRHPNPARRAGKHIIFTWLRSLSLVYLATLFTQRLWPLESVDVMWDSHMHVCIGARQSLSDKLTACCAAADLT